MSFPLTKMAFRIRIALGADRTADPATWTWTDVSAYLRASPGVTIQHGAADEFGSTPPAIASLTLDNRDGRFSRLNPYGPYFGELTRGTPIEIAVDPDGGGYHVRFTGEVIAWPKRWDRSGRDSWVPISCAGRSRTLGQSSALLRSALTRYLPTTDPIAWWPCEDGVASSRVASGLPGGPALQVQRGDVEFTADSPTGADGALKPSEDRNPLTAPLSGGTAAGWQVAIWVKTVQATASTLSTFLPILIETPTHAISLALQRDSSDVDNAYVIAYPWGYPDSGVQTVVGGSSPDAWDGGWHLLQATLQQAGSDIDMTLYWDGEQIATGTRASATLGAPQLARLQSAYLSQTTVINLADWGISHPVLHNGVALQPLYEAGIGHLGERAGRRIERLCDEESVALEVPGEYRVTDDFDRTETAEWGDATTGEAWTASGGSAADYDVTGGQGLIEQPSATVLRRVILGDDLQGPEFDAVVLVEVPQVATGGSVGMHAGIVARWVSDTDHIRCQLRYTPGGGITLGWVEPGGAGVAIGVTADVADSYDAGDRYWLRAVGIGSRFRARAWLEGEAEPRTWMAFGASGDYEDGSVGVFARRGTGDTSSSNTFAFESWSSRSILDETEPMGVQGPDALMTLLRDAETVDRGALQDAQTAVALQFIARVARYNMPYALDLVVGDGDIGAPPEPTDDDQQYWNRVTATRAGGSSVTVQDDAAIAAAGGIIVDAQITVPCAYDHQLLHQAGWHLAAGVHDGDRYPQVVLNLARRPALITAWAAVVPGAARMRITGLPDQAGPDPVDQIIEGYTETIAQFVWTVTCYCSPADLWTVGVLEDPTLGRVDTDGTVLAADFVVGTDTTMDIDVTDGPGWIPDPGLDGLPQWPVDARVGGARVTVLAVGELLSLNAWMSGTVDDWAGQNGTVAYSTAVQRTPAYGSALVTPAGTGVAEIRASALITGISVGDDYLVGAWIYTPGGWASGFRAGCNWHDGGGGFLSTSQTAITVIPAGEWTWLAATHTAPASAAQARPFASQQGTPSGSDIWYATGIVVVPTASQADTLTVDQTPVNGVTRPVPAGQPVSLWTPWRAAL